MRLVLYPCVASQRPICGDAHNREFKITIGLSSLDFIYSERSHPGSILQPSVRVCREWVVWPCGPGTSPRAVQSGARNIRDGQLLLGFMDPAVAGRCHRRSKGITRAVTERTLARICGGRELTHTSGYTWVKSKSVRVVLTSFRLF